MSKQGESKPVTLEDIKKARDLVKNNYIKSTKHGIKEYDLLAQQWNHLLKMHNKKLKKETS